MMKHLEEFKVQELEQRLEMAAWKDDEGPTFEEMVVGGPGVQF